MCFASQFLKRKQGGKLKVSVGLKVSRKKKNSIKLCQARYTV